MDRQQQKEESSREEGSMHKREATKHWIIQHSVHKRETTTCWIIRHLVASLLSLVHAVLFSATFFFVVVVCPSSFTR